MPAEGWRRSLHLLGRGWGGSAVRGRRESRDDIPFRETRQGRPVHPKEGNCFVYVQVWIKILMSRDIDFEPKMGFRFWFGYTNSGNTSILNNFISFLVPYLLAHLLVSQVLSPSGPIGCSPSSSSCPDMKPPSLSSLVQTGFSTNCQLSSKWLLKTRNCKQEEGLRFSCRVFIACIVL